MRKIYVLLIFCLLILSVFTSCEEPKQPLAITITLDSGVLEEKVSTISTVENEEVTLPSGETIWETDRYSFSGWAATKDGEVSYKAETSFSSSSDVTLYAIWTENPKITYLANGGTGDAIIEYHKSGEKVKIKNSSFTKTGWSFRSWNTVANRTGTSYTSGQEITLTDDITLYAIWSQNTVTLTYDPNYEGGTAKTVSVVPGTVTLEPSTLFTRDGYSLISWNTSSDGEGTGYNPGSSITVNSNTVLYAVWEKQDLLYTLNADENSYSVKAANTDISGSITIPSEYNGKNVTTIADYAFANCKNVTSVTIPNTVTSIGLGAFFRSGITSIEIPDSVTTTGGAVFSQCSSLKTVKLSSKMTQLNAGDISTDTYSAKGTGFFQGCTTLKTVGNLDKILTIGQRAFYECSAIEKLELKATTASIGEFAFYGCSSMKDVSIPGLTSIEPGLFNGCSSLTSIDIPDTVTSIGRSAFAASGLTSITIPDKVTSVDSFAFAFCTELASVSIPESMTSIGDSAFMGDTLLTAISIPGKVTSIGTNAFSSCDKLESISIDREKGSIADENGNKWGAPSTDCTVTWKKITAVGDTITLGTVAWKALSVDSENKCALLISQDVLENRAFDNSSTSYENSAIRTYLKSDEFFKTYDLSTNYMEKVDVTSSIETTTVGSGSDYIFLLSKTEAENTNYFADASARIADNTSGSPSLWWLRSSCNEYSYDYVYHVDTQGSILYYNNTGNFGIRPAFWYTWN